MGVFNWPAIQVTASSGPTEFVRDGADTQVSLDTGTPANSRPLPVRLLDTNGAELSPATLAEQQTQSTRIGDLTEAAPASDTASSGLNGRLQRIAQRITSLIGLLPASLGQKVKTGSLSVVLASDQDTVPVSAASLPLPTGAATEATLSALNTKVTAVDTGAVTVASSALPTGASTLAEQQTQSTRLGDLTEAAPASDTASSGINGRLQRIAQRITSLIGLLPASIGQKNAAGSLSVVLASDAVTPKQNGYSYADSVRRDYSGGAVTTGAWTQLIAATAGAAQGILLFDSSGQTLELGIGAAASESRLLIIPPGGLNGFIPVAIPAGSRVSVKAISAQADVGELNVTLLG
jgi:hypothetical protein